MLEDILEHVDGRLEVTMGWGNKLLWQDIWDLVAVQLCSSCQECTQLRRNELRTPIDETHRNVKLCQVEFPSIINIRKGPAIEAQFPPRPHINVNTYQIFARSFLSNPLCPNTSSAVCPLMNPVPCISQARKI